MSEVPAKRKPNPGRNLGLAIPTGIVLLGYIIATLIWWPWGFAIFIAIALVAGMWELNRMLQKLDVNAAFWPIVVLTPITVLGSYWIGSTSDGLGHALSATFVGVMLSVLIAMLWRLRLGVAGFVRDSAGSFLMIGYFLVLGSTIILMLADDRGPVRVATYLICVVAADTGAYAVGVLFGKNKMAPGISPAKSWEGFFGGVVTAMLVGAFLTSRFLEQAWWFGAIFGAMMAAFGAAGDLIESAIKRDVQVKDSSQLLPGHGGAMDRLDSLLFAAPVAWVLLFIVEVPM